MDAKTFIDKVFNLFQEAKDVKILDARIFTSFQGTGVAIMTSTFRIFLITNSDSPRIIRLAEVPGETLIVFFFFNFGFSLNYIYY